MIHTAIGLPDNRTGVYAEIQDWMHEHGLGTYEPQRRHGEGDLAQEWDAGTRTMRWKPATLAMMRNLDYPLLWHVGSYHYATKPNILRNIIPQLPFIRDHLYKNNVDGWFLLDEPPHAPQYGWTAAIEDVVVDWSMAVVNAGLHLGVAMPGVTQLRFWKERIVPTFWILNDKHSASAWRPDLGVDQCWLYNAADFAALAFRIQLIGAQGYLHWSGVDSTKTNPTPIMFSLTDDGGFMPTPAVYQLIDELNPKPLTLEERMTRAEADIATLKAMMP